MAQHNESLVVIETEEAQRQRHAAAIAARNREPLDRALRKGGVYRDAAGRYVDAHGHPLAPDDVRAYEEARDAREARVARALPRAVGMISTPTPTAAPAPAAPAPVPVPSAEGEAGASASAEAEVAPAPDAATDDPPAKPAKPAKGAKGAKG